MRIIVVGALGADMGTITVETWCQLLRWSSKIPVIRSLQEIRPLRLVSLLFSVWGLSALPEPELWQRNLGMGTGTQMQRKAKNHCITLYQYGMISWVSCHVCLHCYSDDLSSSFLFLLIHIEVWSNTYDIILCKHFWFNSPSTGCWASRVCFCTRTFWPSGKMWSVQLLLAT